MYLTIYKWRAEGGRQSAYRCCITIQGLLSRPPHFTGYATLHCPPLHLSTNAYCNSEPLAIDTTIDLYHWTTCKAHSSRSWMPLMYLGPNIQVPASIQPIDSIVRLSNAARGVCCPSDRTKRKSQNAGLVRPNGRTFSA